MRVRILGNRVLVKAYTLPEKIGSLYVPDYVTTQYDGRTWEVVAVSPEVERALAVGMVNGDDVYPVLSEGMAGLDPLRLEPDDILILRYQWRGVWAGPEIRDAYGHDCWFLNVVEKRNRGGKMVDECIISKVIPSRTWKEVAA